ncbi:MAG TPA: enolase C-terminal domain-like protein [Chitinophagaceae bacterium]|jgi:L-alanine-DL-glutamate epimerase-like enolase superfamily enzyme
MMNEITTVSDSIRVKQLTTSAYKIPTATPESDGTLKWNQTTLITVEIEAGGKVGIGYTYADASVAFLIDRSLKKLITGKNIFDIPAITNFLIQQIRNDGSCGIAMMAISAIDNALWDLKAKIIEQPLCNLLGQAKDKMLLYGSGGFTNYSNKETEKQFNDWEEEGIEYVKMKIGTEPEKDVERVKAARSVINKKTKIFVDANGAYTVKQAIEKSEQFEELGVYWFEEPVASDNLDGLHFIRQHAPSQINIAAGEYGYNLPYFKQMLSANAVDILQADATRCGGITGFLKAGYLAEAFQIPFSSHCAPSLHLHAALSLPSFYIAEYFFDHVRIESMFFDGVAFPRDGYLKPDLSRHGLGIEFKHKDAEKFRI